MKYWTLLKTMCAGYLLVCGAALASASVMVTAECARRNVLLSEQIARGQLDDAKRSVADSVNGPLGREPVCAGLLANALAARLQMAGRLDEARTFAEQAIKYFQRSLPEDDPALLPPLHILVTIDLLQGMTGRAREAFRRMQVIGMTKARDRVLVLWVSASLLEREGRAQEAESALIGALSALSDAGRQDSADAATIKGQLARLYIHKKQYGDAAAAVNNALATLNLAADATALHRIDLLNIRAAVWAHENRWRDAEPDLREAVSLARQQPKLDSVILLPLLKNYADVLRRMHSKELRSVEKWAASLQNANTASRQVIDVTELAANGPGDR